MKGSLIIVNQNTFEVEIKAAMDAVVHPSPLTIAIQQKSEEVKAKLDNYLKTVHGPLVTELLYLVDQYNYEHCPEVTAKRDAEKAVAEEAKRLAVAQEASRLEEQKKQKKKGWFKKK